MNGSKKHDKGTGWYDLDESIYNTLMSADNAYQAIIIGEPKTTFGPSKNVVKDIFSAQSKLQGQGKSNRWMFSVSENNSRYFLVLGRNVKYDITEYLNKWNVIPELSNANDGGVRFTKLQRFLLDEMQMQANYQPIMIKTLLESGGRASRDEIAARIRELNSDNLEQDFRNIPVYEVLEKHGIVQKENDHFILNIGEITSDERKQLLVLCDWKIPNSPLDLEELIKAFDANMNLFDPDGYDPSQRDKDHQMFVARFSSENIMNMQLDEYVAGKPDPKTGQVNRSTFCYLLEFGLSSFGRIGGRSSRKFGISYRKESNQYTYNKKYSSAEQAFNHIKAEIHSGPRLQISSVLTRIGKNFLTRLKKTILTFTEM